MTDYEILLHSAIAMYVCMYVYMIFNLLFFRKLWYRIYEEKYTIDLRNSSLITTNIEIEFIEDTTIFQLDKTFISLEVSSISKN